MLCVSMLDDFHNELCAGRSFNGNVASNGGGAYLYQASNMTITHCNFTSNVANTGSGGGFYAVSHVAKILIPLLIHTCSCVTKFPRLLPSDSS